MTTREIFDAITNGDADDDLNMVLVAVKQRKEYLATRNFHQLEVGDRVTIKQGTIKPRYLDLAKATIVEKRISRITIRFDDDILDPYGKWAGKTAVVGAGMIEKEVVEDS